MYEMRRKKQALSQTACEEVLQNATSGVLAVVDPEGEPYAVPLNFVYDDNKIYFHSAPVGRKMQAIRHNARVSFCVIDRDEVVPALYTTKYRSVIVFGTAREIADEREKKTAIELLAVKYAPNDSAENREKAIADSWSRFCMVELKIERMSGKIGRLLL